MIIETKALDELVKIHYRKTGYRLTNIEALKMGINLIQATQLVFRLDPQGYLCHPESNEQHEN